MLVSMHGAGLFQESQDNKIWSQDSQDKQHVKQLIYINPERTILMQAKQTIHESSSFTYFIHRSKNNNNFVEIF